MTSRFRGRATARRVAAVAVTGAAGIMGPGATGEGRRGVAKVAVKAGRQMCRHRVILSGCGITVMTGLAAAGDAGMIESRRHETTGIMADAAILVGRDVIA